MGDKLKYISNGGYEMSIDIDLRYDKLTLSNMLKLQDLSLHNNLDEDISTVIDMIKYSYCNVLRIPKSIKSDTTGGIISLVKDLEVYSVKIDPVLKTLLGDILTAVTTHNKPVFKNYAFLKPNNEYNKIKTDFKINYNTNLKSATDELMVLFNKYTIAEVVDMMLALLRIGYQVVDMSDVSTANYI